MKSKVKQVIVLTSKEQEVFKFITEELESWRISEPSYSCIDVSDVSKNFSISKKAANTICKSLAEKGLISFSSEGDFKDILYPNWENIEAAGIGVQAQQPEVPQSTNTGCKPYKKYGMHGTNHDLEDYKKGDLIEFDLKGNKVVGEYVHLHVNKHSPNGYVVLRFEGKIYERTPNKISKHVPEQKKTKRKTSNK